MIVARPLTTFMLSGRTVPDVAVAKAPGKKRLRAKVPDPATASPEEKKEWRFEYIVDGMNYTLETKRATYEKLTKLVMVNNLMKIKQVCQVSDKQVKVHFSAAAQKNYGTVGDVAVAVLKFVAEMIAEGSADTKELRFQARDKLLKELGDMGKG